MNNLLTIKEQDILPGSPVVHAPILIKRQAARAVLLDNIGQVYLLNVSKYSYHKLPGGGIDEGEDIQQTLERELMEEVGCKAEILAELGTVIEYRHSADSDLEQTSYYYVAQQVGEQVASALQEDELDEGMTAVKAKSIDDAIAILSQDKPGNLEGQYIQRRDLAFLKAAKELM